MAGFGCLREFAADFAPGINVVFGLNEAGKSTLQQAICAMLFGFYEGERGKTDEKRRHERFRPWPEGGEISAPFRGVLEYEMQSGETFEVRRDFSSADLPTQVIDLSLGADISSRFGQGRHGNIPFARKQLGMSRGVFQSCAFIAQGEIFAASQGASPREIGDAIAAMADSARRDVSASAALTRLDGLMLRIGSDRARTAELPRARENLREAEGELAQIDTVRTAVSERARELEQTRSRQAELKTATAALRAQYLLARRASLSRRIEALGEVEATLERAGAERERLATYESFPADLRDRVVALDDRRLGGERRVVSARGELEARAAAVTETMKLEFEALRVSVGALSAESLAGLEQVAYRPILVNDSQGTFLSRLIGRIAGVVAAVFRSVFRRSPVAAAAGDDCLESEGALAPEVTPMEAIELLERFRRYLTLKPTVESFDEASARLTREQQGLSLVKSELSGLLGFGPDDELAAAVAEFLRGCEMRAAYDASVVAQRDAQLRRDGLLSGRTREEMGRLLDESDARLRELLNENPELDPPVPSESTAAIEERMRNLETKRHELELVAARLEEELRGALGDQRERADVEEDVARWRKETARLEKARASVLIAREVIDEAMTAVYRDFAPAVSSFLSDGFTHVTEGRYQRALVDPKTLEVSLLLPETHQVIKDPPVSRGTLALAYILMRIGLAQHMSAVAEPVPLVLDDPFVDLDERRLNLTLDFIAELSERMQIFLFTKDPAIARWLETRVPGERHRVHSLDGVPSLTGVL